MHVLVWFIYSQLWTKDKNKYLNIQILWVLNKYLYSNSYILYSSIFKYSPFDQNILANIFFLFCSNFHNISSSKCILFNIIYFGSKIYQNIHSNFGLKYMWIVVCEDFNLSNIFAYLFDEFWISWIYSNICSDPFILIFNHPCSNFFF